jgi:hypothetical protein
MKAERLKSNLESGLMPSSALLGQCKVLDLSSRESSAYNDPKYFPFYYHLGKEAAPAKVEQIGAKLGLIAACFMQGCDHPVDWLVMEPFVGGVRPPMNIIESNIKKFCKVPPLTEFQNHCCGLNIKNLLIEGEVNYRFDMGMLTDKYDAEDTNIVLDYFWRHLSSEGLLVVDYIHDEAVRDVFLRFCRVKNRDPEIFDTRYGVGIVTR